MRKIIVNADDFGRHTLINQAVVKGVQTGFLRSATLMPGGAAFAEAVHIAEANPKLGVGVHFTLVNGTPVLPPADIPSLTTDNGKFYDDYGSFMQRYLRGKISLTEVQAELAAQLNKVQNTKLNITHADSHQHLHHLPGILGTVLSLAQAAGIKCLRAARPKFTVQAPRSSAGESGGLKQMIGRLGLTTLGELTAYRAKRKNFRVPDHFMGIVAGEAITETKMRQFIRTMPEGVTEIMLHPGLNNAVLAQECGWAHDFEAELNAVTAANIIVMLKERQIIPINFGELSA